MRVCVRVCVSNLNQMFFCEVASVWECACRVSSSQLASRTEGAPNLHTSSETCVNTCNSQH